MERSERDHLWDLIDRVDQGHQPYCGQTAPPWAGHTCTCSLPNSIAELSRAARLALPQLLRDSSELAKTKDELSTALAWLKAESDDIDLVAALQAAGHDVVDSESSEGCSPDLTVISAEAFARLKAAVEWDLEQEAADGQD